MTNRTAIRAIVEKWMRADHMRLHAGEMTAQEVRTARAVLNAAWTEIDIALASGEKSHDANETKNST